MAEELIKKSRYRSLKKQSFNNSQLQCLYSVSSNSLNSSQSSCSPTRLRYSIPPSTAQAPHEQNLKSCTEVLSMISPHFRHFILFTLIIFFSINSSLRLSSFNRHTRLCIFALLYISIWALLRLWDTRNGSPFFPGTLSATPSLIPTPNYSLPFMPIFTFPPYLFIAIRQYIHGR